MDSESSEIPKKTGFLMPKSEVSSKGQRYLVPVYHLPKEWQVIHEFWVRSSKDLKLRFCANEYTLSDVHLKRDPDRTGFVKIPFFDWPFPRHLVVFQDCRVQIIGDCQIPLLYVVYSNASTEALHQDCFTRKHRNGAVISFAFGRVGFATLPSPPSRPEVKEITKSYSEVLEDLSQLIQEGGRRQINITPLSASNYVKVLTDLGFDGYEVKAKPGHNTTIIFNCE